jgi:putative ubiquitin-RnfH superfamily antitoxin RatB of RatAB toxin-antitoxin module
LTTKEKVKQYIIQNPKTTVEEVAKYAGIKCGRCNPLMREIGAYKVRTGQYQNNWYIKQAHDKVKVGDKVIVCAPLYGDGKITRRHGVIHSVYKNFVVVQFKNYRECFNEGDLEAV